MSDEGIIIVGHGAPLDCPHCDESLDVDGALPQADHGARGGALGVCVQCCGAYQLVDGGVERLHWERLTAPQIREVKLAQLSTALPFVRSLEVAGLDRATIKAVVAVLMAHAGQLETRAIQAQNPQMQFALVTQEKGTVQAAALVRGLLAHAKGSPG